VTYLEFRFCEFDDFEFLYMSTSDVTAHLITGVYYFAGADRFCGQTAAANLQPVVCTVLVACALDFILRVPNSETHHQAQTKSTPFLH